ncbi:MAG: hypothetical protein DRH03_10635 [Deltaproteobacteria bacterium]|nr:MAG: hypothetical protein DRH03_10635 [Deltaproteobacteria bacterium]
MLSIVSVIFGVVSFFLNDLSAVGVAFLAVMVAFLASRCNERYFVFGMLLGAIVLNFVCLQHMDILKSETKTQVENVYRSLRLSNQVFGMMKDGNPDEINIISVIDQLLQIAREVDTELLDSSLLGFKQHFESDYIEGYALLKQGIADSDIGKKLKGSIHADLWAQWNIDNKDELEKLRQSKPSLISFALSKIK